MYVYVSVIVTVYAHPPTNLTHTNPPIHPANPPGSPTNTPLTDQLAPPEATRINRDSRPQSTAPLRKVIFLLRPVPSVRSLAKVVTEGPREDFWAKIMQQSALISERLFICQYVDTASLCKSFTCFRIDAKIRYRALCDDFGPMDLASIVRFIKSLECKLNEHPKYKILFCVADGKRAFTNAIFLLGCYMILKEEMSLRRVVASFSRLDAKLLEPYRDSTFAKPDFSIY